MLFACRRQVFMLELFAEQVMLELQCRESLIRASKNTNAVFSATKQMKRMQGHGCWKASFSVKKVLMQF